MSAERRNRDGIPPVCILAGGMGTRLGARAAGNPKPLVEVAGQPFLLHQLAHLAGNGIERVVLCVSYRGRLIEDSIGSTRFGIHIDYSYDGETTKGTLGALRGAIGLLGDRFMVLYGDTYLDLDYRDVLHGWNTSGLPAMMTVLHNRGRWGRSNVLYRNGIVERYEKVTPTPTMEWIDYGLGGFETRLLNIVGVDATDLGVLQAELARRRLLCGIESKNRFYEIGTPGALDETEQYFRSLDDTRNM